MKATGRWAWGVFVFVYSLVIPDIPAPAQDAIARQTPTTNLATSGTSQVVPQWQSKRRTAHQTEWQSVRYSTNPVTGRVRATTNSYVELATGLNRRDANGRWQAASDAFQITTNGAEANFGQHRVRLAPNINRAGSVRVDKGTNRLEAHPLCVAYYDPVDGRSQIIGVLRDSIGWLAASNEVVYSNCFDGLNASIRYRNSRSGLEQDLVLHERPSITPRDIGFSEKTRIEIFTEWVGQTPMPTAITRVLQEEKSPAVRQLMAEPDFTDQTLRFGGMRMGRGRAFNTSQDGRAVLKDTLPVGKRFEIIEGRKILIEAVPMEAAAPLLQKLSAPGGANNPTNAALRYPSATNLLQMVARPPTSAAGTATIAIMTDGATGRSCLKILLTLAIHRTENRSSWVTGGSTARHGSVKMVRLPCPPAFSGRWAIRMAGAGRCSRWMGQPRQI